MSNSRTLSYFLILTFLFMILIFSALASSNLSCLQTMAQTSTTTTTTISSNPLTYNNSTYGIKIQYPENWQENPANGFLGAVVIFSPQGVNQTKGQVELDISVIPSTNMSLDVLVQKELENYKSLLSNFKIIESSPITFHGNPALMILSNSTNPISGVVKSINIFTIKYGNLYLISYGAKPEIYSAYLPIAEKMINSFEIIKPSVEHNNNNNNLQKTITTPGNVVGNNTVAAIIPSSSNLLTYENSTLGIRFEYPTDWKYYLSFVSNSTASEDEVRFDLLIASLTISVRDLPFFLQNASIQQMTKVMTDIFNGTGPYFKVLSLGNATLSGYPGQKMEISYNYPSQPKINETSIFTIKNGRLYSVAFDGDAAYYNTFLPTAQKINDSFRITK
jgi:PsbP-like protein